MRHLLHKSQRNLLSRFIIVSRPQGEERLLTIFMCFGGQARTVAHCSHGGQDLKGKFIDPLVASICCANGIQQKRNKDIKSLDKLIPSPIDTCAKNVIIMKVNCGLIEIY